MLSHNISTDTKLKWEHLQLSFTKFSFTNHKSGLKVTNMKLYILDVGFKKKLQTNEHRCSKKLKKTTILRYSR